jgi:AcrR family transcriptional regulator
VGIGTIYRHFPTRQTLQEAVYRDQIEMLAAEADELMLLFKVIHALSVAIEQSPGMGDRNRAAHRRTGGPLTGGASSPVGVRKVWR